MRVLKVTQSYHPYAERGGPVVKVGALASHLAERGHAVTVLTADLGPRSGAGPAGPDVVYLRTAAAYRAITVNPGVFGFCRERLADFDVAHIYGTYDLLGPVVAAQCRRRGIPYVVEPMGMYRPIMRSLAKKRLYHRLLGARLIAGAAAVVATAENERRDLLAGGVPAERIVLRRNGVELPAAGELPARGALRRRFGIAADAPLLLFLGRLSRKKGLDLLMEAFAGLGRRDAHLVVVGPDDDDGAAEAVLRDAATTGTADRVHLTGPLFEADKLAAFVDADVFVLPSRNENFGNAAAEAVACGVPVVVTETCGIAPLIDGAGAVVVPCTADGVRAGLSRILGDDTFRARLRAAGRAKAPDLSWSEPVSVMERVYEDAVRRAAPGDAA